MAKKAGKDATETTSTVTPIYLNNSTAPSSISKSVDLVVINNQVVPDPNQVNPGVVINAQQTK